MSQLPFELPAELLGGGTPPPSDIAGTLFTKAPTFATGAISAGAVNLTGTLFTNAPTFPTGTVTPGSVALTGTLFTKAPTFPTGVITAGAPVLTGTLFVKTPTFVVGVISGGVVQEPDDIAGLILWLKADAITGLSDGDDLLTWEDSSSAGNDAASIEVGDDPTYETNELFGLPVVRFGDGSPIVSMDPGINLIGPCTIAYVGRQSDGSTGNRRAIASSSDNRLLGPYGGFWQFHNGDFAAPGPDSTDQAWVIHLLSQDAVLATHYVYELTSEDAPFSSSPPGIADFGLVTLGGWATGEPYFGDFAEVIVYDEQISAPDQDALVAYLRLKWAGVIAEQTLTGTLFTKTPTFFTGTVTSDQDLTGTLFTSTPVFSGGAVVGSVQNLTGTLFTKTPTFSTGTVTADVVALTGILFTKAPTFFVGAITTGAVDLTGTLFTKAPTFPTGVVTGDGIQALTGTLLAKAPTFPVGVVSLGAGGTQALTGTLFTKAPTFATGVIGGTVAPTPTVVLVGSSIRVEVWSLPDDPGGFRLLCEPPFLNGTSFQDRADVYGGGQLVVPADYEHLGLIVDVDPSDIASSHSSIVRGLQFWPSDESDVDGEWHVVWEFFADEAEEDITKEGQRVVVVTGLDVRAAPDDGIVYPRQPTSPHWEWGAPTMLENAGFEDSGFTNLLIHLWLEDTVSAGTWNIEFDDGTPDDVTLNWNTDLPAVQTGIEALDNITDILIAGAGTEPNPWVIEVIDPAGTDFNVTVDSAGLTGGAALMLSQHQGGAGVVDPWTRAFNPATGLFHGTYTNFQVSTVQAHTGTSSLYVKGSLGPWPDSWPGGQQIVSVGEGEHWAAVWVYPLFAARYRFVLRTTDETLIGFVEADLAANSWQELRIEPVVFPLYVAQIIFRISCISNTPNDHEFFFDDGTLAPGFPATTWGDILTILIGQAFTRGTLDWLDLGFDAAVDSDGVTWDTDEFAFQADALMKLGSHVIADGETAGYEHDVVPIDPPGVLTHILHAYNPQGRGDVSFQAAVVGSFNAARVAKRRVPYTHLLLELNDGTHVEVADTRLSGFGRRERGVRVEQATDPFTAEKIGQAIFDKEIPNLLATQITLSGDSVLPYRDFDIGWIVPHTLAQRALKHDRRIQVITSAFSQSRWVYVVTAGGVEVES